MDLDPEDSVYLRTVIAKLPSHHSFNHSCDGQNLAGYRCRDSPFVVSGAHFVWFQVSVFVEGCCWVWMAGIILWYQRKERLRIQTVGAIATCAQAVRWSLWLTGGTGIWHLSVLLFMA